MNIKNLLLVIGTAAALSSCSTAYKAGQTPDDVYYSPARQQQQEEYVDVQRQQDRYSDRYSANNYDSYDSYRDDRFLRMSLGSPLRLSAYNDYLMYNGFMGYNSWRFNSSPFGFSSPMNGFYYWNTFYNPYNTYDYYYPSYGFGGLYGGGFGGYLPGNVIVKTPSLNPVSRPRAFVPGSYAATNSYGNTSRYLDRPATTNSSSRGTYLSPGRYNNTNNSSGLGNTMRRIITGSSDNTYYSNSNSRSSNSSSSRNNTNTYTPPTRSYEAPTRSYSPSSSGGSSGGGSSSGGGGGVSRPTRGGN